MTIASLEHFIAGQHAAGVSTRTQPVYNPATGAVTANVSLASSDDVNTAVAAAQKASGDGAHVDVPGGHCCWQHLCLEAQPD